MNSLTIDSLQFENLPGLKTLYEKGFGATDSNFENMLSTFERIKNNPDYVFLIAKIEEQVIGSVMGVLCYELYGDCRPFLVVENVVVLNDFKGQGIAKSLMVRLEEMAREKSCSMILFVSSAHRTNAHKLYESLGYGEDKVNGYRKRL